MAQAQQPDEPQSPLQPLDDRKITILYGSQTGNAIDVSERIAFELQRKWFKINLMSMTQYLSAITQFNPNCLFPDNIIIFVASTTGQGDVPDNMKVTMYITVPIFLSSPNIRPH